MYLFTLWYMQSHYITLLINIKWHKYLFNLKLQFWAHVATTILTFDPIFYENGPNHYFSGLKLQFYHILLGLNLQFSWDKKKSKKIFYKSYILFLDLVHILGPTGNLDKIFHSLSHAYTFLCTMFLHTFPCYKLYTWK